MSYFSNFLKNTDHREVFKWSQYFEAYEKELLDLRDKEVTFLEIGIYLGGSIPMWKGFFKRASKLIFIDINESCLRFKESDTEILIGDQSDKTFLNKLIEDYAPFDIVIDDGSHKCNHQIISFETLWPYLKNNGIYLVEDTHSSYWPGFGGGYKNESSFIEYSKRIVDKMHSWWTDQDDIFPFDPFAKEIGGVRFYDSMVAFTKKNNKPRPVQVRSVNGQISTDSRAFGLRERKSKFG